MPPAAEPAPQAVVETPVPEVASEPNGQPRKAPSRPRRQKADDRKAPQEATLPEEVVTGELTGTAETAQTIPAEATPPAAKKASSPRRPRAPASKKASTKVTPSATE